MKLTPMQALDKAIEIAGTQAELARRIAEIKKDPRIKPQHIWNWRNRDEEVPAEMVLAMEEAVAGKPDSPSRHQIRPDIYPHEARAA